MSYGDKAFWQDVEEPATDQFVRRDGFALPLCIGTIFVTQEEATFLIVAGEATLVEGGPGHIAGEVAQGGAAAAGGSTIGHPFFLPDSGIDLAVQLGVTAKQALGKQMANASGKRVDVDEKLFVWRMYEVAAIVA